MTDHGSTHLRPVYLKASFSFPVEFIAAAVLFSADGRYLFQLRDDKKGLPLRDHWALFGGAVDPGEDGRAAVLREIKEELTYEARHCVWFHEAIYVLPRTVNRVVRKAFYLMNIEADDVDGMTQCEGSDMRLMSLDELLGLPNVAPWDLAVVMMHARQQMIFPDE
jgi:8-oxo-dGTP pyrophosphatase MutT (NUDIX family)